MAQQKAVEPVDEVEDLVDELQPGSKLLKGQYTITRYLNAGGFGITYLAKDSLDRDVVIKECFPSSVCRRSKVVVAARSRAHTAELRSIVQLFVREARSLAKIVHPNIVAVHQVFEDNGTAYMAIDYIDGLDLQQIIDGEGEAMTPEHIVQITEKLLHAVGYIHDHDMLHRDISPDNVLIDKTGKPILIDFGAAREHASKSTRAMSALRVVKDGYSPQEFYIAGSEQGPWSDLYALGATLYHLISGEAPVNGQARLAALAEDRSDPYVPLTGRFPAYPPGFLEAIDRSLATLPKQRLQSAAAWLEMYHAALAAPAPVSVAVAEAPVGVDDAVHRLLDDFKREEPQGAPVVKPSRPLAKAASRAPDVAAIPAPVARGKSPVQLVAGVAVALAVLAGGYVMLGGPKTPVGDDGAAQATDAAPKPADAAPATESASLVPTAADPAPEAAEKTQPQAEAAPVSETAATGTADSAVAESGTVETRAADPKPATETTAANVPPADAAEPVVAAIVEASEAPAQPTATAAAEDPAPAVAGPTPAASQIAFAAWDVEMPFAFDDRMVDGKRVAVVTRFTPGIDAQRAGDWLAPGVTIDAVNGTPVDSTRSLTVSVMNAMAVDPDGKARVVVEYSDRYSKRMTGLLTVGAVRLVNLQNGVSCRVSVVDGAWRTEVIGVSRPDMTSLATGDVLFRDKTTSAALDGPMSLETVLSDLVAQGASQTGFSVIRDNKVNEATMQLVLAKGQ